MRAHEPGQRFEQGRVVLGRLEAGHRDDARRPGGRRGPQLGGHVAHAVVNHVQAGRARAMRMGQRQPPLVFAHADNGAGPSARPAAPPRGTGARAARACGRRWASRAACRWLVGPDARRRRGRSSRLWRCAWKPDRAGTRAAPRSVRSQARRSASGRMARRRNRRGWNGTPARASRSVTGPMPPMKHHRLVAALQHEPRHLAARGRWPRPPNRRA